MTLHEFLAARLDEDRDQPSPRTTAHPVAEGEPGGRPAELVITFREVEEQ